MFPEYMCRLRARNDTQDAHLHLHLLRGVSILSAALVVEHAGDVALVLVTGEQRATTVVRLRLRRQ